MFTKKSQFLLFLGFLIYISCAKSDEGACELDEPWLSDEVASLLLTSSDVVEGLRAPSPGGQTLVEKQLLLWAYLKGKLEISDVRSRFSVESDEGQYDDSIMALLWIIAETGIDVNDELGLDNILDQLNAWSNNAIKESPRKMVLTLIAASRVSGQEKVTLRELEFLGFQMRDPEVLASMAGKLLEDDRYEMAHALLVEAVENGLLSAIYGLGEVEATHFPSCASRGAMYRQLFSAVWLRNKNLK